MTRFFCICDKMEPKSLSTALIHGKYLFRLIIYAWSSSNDHLSVQYRKPWKGIASYSQRQRFHLFKVATPTTVPRVIQSFILQLRVPLFSTAFKFFACSSRHCDRHEKREENSLNETILLAHEAPWINSRPLLTSGR